ncbi:hypothetical protein [Kaistia sp. MMO-174]|uniref:hypothetical protein n=1 Tax=Kaistia sp. MMO-174 TaxID=3081256 RepID=UPI003017B9D7
MSSRRRKSWRLSASATQIAGLAAKVFEGHAGLIERGATLMPTSGAWYRKDGSVTGRFVYRYPSKGSEEGLTVVATVRNIRVQQA